MDPSEKNVLFLINQKGNLESCPDEISKIINAWENNPEINLYEETKKNGVQLCYPMLLLYDQAKEGYDETIKKVVSFINEKLSEQPIDPEISIQFFFVFIPVESSKLVKEQVIKWISEKKPLI